MSTCTADWGNHSETNPLARPDSHETSIRAMSSGNAPKSAGDGCAGKDGMADGMARARKKKRAPDQWQMLIVSKHMQNAAGGHHQQPPCSFSSKEVAEPQPALDPGEESDTGSCYSDDPGSDNQGTNTSGLLLVSPMNSRYATAAFPSSAFTQTCMYPSAPPHRRRLETPRTTSPACSKTYNGALSITKR